MAGITIPTGFETQEQKIALRQKLAEAMLEAGMQQQSNIRSPFQVLGQLAQAFAGKRMEGRAIKDQGDLNNQIRASYVGARDGLMKDVAAGMSPQDLVAKYGSNPFLQEDLKPYMAGVTKGQESAAELTNVPGLGFHHKGEYINKPMPNDPNDDVWTVPGPNGQPMAIINPIKAKAHMYSNPNLADPTQMPDTYPVPNVAGPTPSQAPAGVVSPSAPAGAPDPSATRAAVINALARSESGNRDFGPDGSPVRSPSGAMFKMQVLPSTAHDPGFGIPPATADTPAEYDRVGEAYFGAMNNRYHDLAKALGAYHDGPGNMDKAGSVQNLSPGTQHYIADTMSHIRVPQPQISAPNGAAPLPKVGTRMGEYIYMGGDPNDKNSWAKDL